MSTSRYFRAQAYNNAWANHRLLAACAALPVAEVEARRTSFFPSIIHTLNHILTVDWFYVSALEGSCIGPSAYEPEIPHVEFASLAHAQRDVDARLTRHCDALTDAMLDDDVSLVRVRGTQIESRDRVLLHLFQHQIHHRGQVHAMLSGTEVPPPQLDEFFLGDEVALRAADFAALGFDEATIWR